MSMSKDTVRDFSDLIAWQKAHQLVLLTYRVVKHFPANEQFILVSQMTRAAISISSNIAEGFGRSTAKDKRQFSVILKVQLLNFEVRYELRKTLAILMKNCSNGLSEMLLKWCV